MGGGSESRGVGHAALSDCGIPPRRFSGRNIPAPFETRGVFPLCEEAFGEGGKRVYMPFQPRAEIFFR